MSCRSTAFFAMREQIDGISNELKTLYYTRETFRAKDGIYFEFTRNVRAHAPKLTVNTGSPEVPQNYRPC